MSPLTRRNSTLAAKIATLQLRLAPLVPLPSGPPHPDFPKTLLAFHLLTENELDSIAHHYHQSTPGPWTQHYPAAMNWDKEFLAKPSSTTAAKGKGRVSKEGSAKRRPGQNEQDFDFLSSLMETVADLSNHAPHLLSSSTTSPTAGPSNPYAGLSEKDRIRIKRRKVGKFIGLVGMETPVEEIAGRIQASLDRAVERSREELGRNEGIMMGRRKMV